MAGQTNESFKNMPSANPHKSTGGQGDRKGAAALPGPDVAGTSNPRGLTAKSLGKGRMPLAQPPVQPKVGK